MVVPNCLFFMDNHTQTLVYALLQLMPSVHQQASLTCLLALFLTAQCSQPSDSKTKSESALSRFLNRYGWSTKKVVRTTRSKIKQFMNIAMQSRRGRRPILYAVVDLTCLEKTGKYKDLAELVRVYNGKRGVHVALLYLCIGPWRLPWSFRVYRGKGTPTPTQLALQLLRQIPVEWRETFKVRVLADAGFSSTELITGAEKLGFEVLMSICCDRRLQDQRAVNQVRMRGERVMLVDLHRPVSLSWFWRKHKDTGEREQHFVVATEALSGAYMIRLGKLRWRIEACFKTLKHRFGWAKFGQGEKLGMYRWWVLCLISFWLVHCQFLSSGEATLDWRKVAQQARKLLFPNEVFAEFLVDVEEMREVASQLGWAITIVPLQRVDGTEDQPAAA